MSAADNGAALVMRGLERAQVRSDKVTITFRVGTTDIRFLAEGACRMQCVRVYEDPAQRRSCGHSHRSRHAAVRCARSMAIGEDSRSREASWVEIVRWTAPKEPKKLSVNKRVHRLGAEEEVRRLSAAGERASATTVARAAGCGRFPSAEDLRMVREVARSLGQEGVLC